MNLIRASASLLLVGSMIVAASASSAFASGNSGAAHLCQQGGYAGLLGTDGTTDVTFANAGQCAGYAAQGGTLVSESAAGVCLNAGFENLASADGEQSPFSSEAACVLYIGQGGTPQPLGFYWTSPTVVPASAGHCWHGFAGSVKISGPIWSSQTWGNPGSALCFQQDGNLVIYSASQWPLWSSGTDGHPGASLSFQTDGNLVIYSTDGYPLWSSRTDGNPGDCVVFQGDGNLVVYSSCG